LAKFRPSRPLYKASRKVRDIEVLASGNPAKIARRWKNKFLGRKIIRKFW
jgi:hypothetical protein